MTRASGIVGEYQSLEAETDADLLAMQVGDFYEFFGESARLVNEELDLKLSEKQSGGESYAMAGVPVSELTPYLRALLERGYRVAVADQDGPDHERSIVRVVTPGTFQAATDADARYLAGIVRREDAVGLAFADVTTGQFRVTTVEDAEADRILTECYRFDPVEVVPGPDLAEDETLLAAIEERTGARVSYHDAEAFAPGRARRTVAHHVGEGAIESLGLDRSGPAVGAAGGVLDYVAETDERVLAAVTRLQPYRPDDHVALDETTQRNLELLETMRGETDGSLFAVLDHTVTSAGRRLLREWLTRPSRSREELDRRQDCVEALATGALAREELRDVLDSAGDLERLAGRAGSGSADARDLASVRSTLELVPTLESVVDRRLADSPLADVLAHLDDEAAAELQTHLGNALVEDPPATLTEGGLIARGYDERLDEIVEEHEAALEWIDGLAERESRRHGIGHLSVDRNSTDGYYIQVGNSETGNVPEHYRQIKSLKNHERYTTDALEERERDVLRLEERRSELEAELFEEVRERVAADTELLQTAGRAIAELDVLASFAVHAVEADWTRPTLAENGTLRVEAGRHPVVEATTEFVPNDLHLDRDRRILLVTGPNMSGKSTYLRQAALLTLLAQVGSFVPAESAHVGLVDGIFTRVGALDELAQGRSTFMVEMQELANILHAATESSLVILDEVGRGTATYDGISIAWATTEYLHNAVGARTLFATHYHELTALAEHLDGVANVHVAVRESGEDVTFLHTVREGPTDRSYGVHVADMAGVPGPVVDRSDEVLERLRAEKAIEARGATGESAADGDTPDPGPQQVVFDLSAGDMRTAETSATDAARQQAADAVHHQTENHLADRYGPEVETVLEDVTDLDVAEIAPVELMAAVQRWQERLEE
jgi:DNA mismatch repair protein MutS